MPSAPDSALSQSPRSAGPDAVRLRPLVGAFTGLLVGAGITIGSGIFRSPAEIATVIPSPLHMQFAWLCGGVFMTLAGMLVAELATRFPQAGGEYVFLREIYGRFVAFFYGWGYTIFVTGGGVAVMAAAFGDFGAELIGRGGHAYTARGIAAAAVAAICGVNLLGLRVGAGTQNLLTLAKVAALLAVVVGAVIWGRPVTWSGSATAAASSVAGSRMDWLATMSVWAGAMMNVFWCYAGTTDSAKLAEETRDPRRALPFMLIGAGVACTTLYLLVNWAFLRVLSPAELAASPVATATIFERWFGAVGGKLALLLAMGVVLGAISSSMVACIRVPFALARDGLTFAFMGRMSRGQTPSGALIVSSAFAIAFALSGRYLDVLSIYTISTGVLFGLVNLSLFVIRLRERAGQPPPIAEYYRCPAGVAVSLLLALTQFLMAVGIAAEDVRRSQGRYTIGSLVLLGAIAVLYVVWPKARARIEPHGAGRLPRP